VNELLKREIASVLFRVMNEQGFDLAAVTVTRVETSSNLRKAQVYVSIRGEAEDQDRMMRLLQRHRVQIQRLVSRDVILKYTPHLYFHLDGSVREGDHILELLEGLDPLPETEDEPRAGTTWKEEP
jgi:ribosome-binding factor A